jgi:Heparinase II/III-like protein/Heparinase II/III N-terminus
MAISRRRAAAPALLTALSLLIAGCGSSSGSDSTVRPPKPTQSLLASWRALEHAPCPPPYLAISRRAHYSRTEVAKARRGIFSIKGHPTKLAPPIDWAMDPYHSKSFRAVLAGLKWIDVLIYAARHGDRAALAEARDIVLDWVRHNPRHRPPSDKSWENKIIGDRAPYLAYIARAAACDDMLSREQGPALVRSLRQHGRALTEGKLYVPSNHGLFMDYGLEALAKEAPFLSKAATWRSLAPRRFYKTLRRRIYPSEGFWLENSSSYHLAVLKLVRDFTALAGKAAPASLRRLSTKMTDVAGWLVEPDGKRVLLGDSNLKATPPEAARAGRGDDGMLFLRRSGIAVVKRPAPDPAYLMFAATFQNGTHNQADADTIDLYDRGQRILTDSGLYDKDQDPWQEFSRSSFSHSVMTIDGRSFPLDKHFRYGSGLRAAGHGDGWFADEGVNPNARRVQGVVATRLVLYKPHYALIVVDSARSKQPHTYQHWFQLAPQIHATVDGGAVELRGKGGFQGELSSTGTAPTQITLLRGQESPVRGWLFPHYRKKVARTTIELSDSGSNVDEAATLSLVRGAPVTARLARRPSAGSVEIRLTKGGRPGPVLRVARQGSTLRLAVR